MRPKEKRARRRGEKRRNGGGKREYKRWKESRREESEAAKWAAPGAMVCGARLNINLWQPPRRRAGGEWNERGNSLLVLAQKCARRLLGCSVPFKCDIRSLTYKLNVTTGGQFYFNRGDHRQATIHFPLFFPPPYYVLLLPPTSQGPGIYARPSRPPAARAIFPGNIVAPRICGHPSSFPQRLRHAMGNASKGSSLNRLFQFIDPRVSFPLPFHAGGMSRCRTFADLNSPNTPVRGIFLLDVN